MPKIQGRRLGSIINRGVNSVASEHTKISAMLSDTFPGQIPQEGDQITICITTDEKDRATQVYEALQQGGQVKKAMQETYFSPAYGLVTDKFGVTFQIHTKKQR
ncbi:hypothetical protein GK047_06815 [Paenibacillus sp. SYP-B3998]|uniref:Uncharacterized protein n=1 Tax=Paenibacillus sp. SYP-B3998 TaxID=2678564 RepID=A0A6G3ZVX9_9BACL|nr:hypothetical protein [Paenibacillus sp. SYP-B3998]